MLNTEDSAAEKQEKAAEKLVQYWVGEITDALKREKSWRKDAKAAVALYENGKDVKAPFNILYSNTETMAPALYNSLPRPEVERRYKDSDPLGLLAGKTVQRTLEYLLDTDLQDYTPFDEMMQSVVVEGLVPGRGVARVKYDAAIAAKPLPQAETDDEGEEGEETAYTYDSVEAETVCVEEIPWDRFLHGYAKKWKDVPWVAFMHNMTKADLKEAFGEELAERVELCNPAETLEDGDAADEEKTQEKFATVWEIWSKAKKQVIFVSISYQDGPLKVVEDPLSLSGFFPCPRPVSFMRRVSALTPNVLYTQYESQAEELNSITTRIKRLITALKVRGAYDSTVAGLDRVLEADDNTLVPVDNVAAMVGQGMTLDKSIMLMPIEKLITVLQQLYTQRQQIKQVIYEITGIADIMRGSSAASETLGAQKIKNEWGTLRLKKAQRETQRFARDMLRLMAEVAVTKLSPETLRKMTGLKYPTAEEKAQAQLVLQQFQQQQQTLPQEALQEPPKEITDAAGSPTWEDILAILQDDMQRSYRIDIETNSTVDLEATEDKENMGEMLNAMAQFLNGVAPMVEQGILPFDAAKSMLLGLVRRYRFGRDVEEQLINMQAPKPQGGADDAKAQAELEMAKQEAAVKMQSLQLEQAYTKAEHEFKMQELQQKQQLAAAKFRQQMQQAMMPKIPAGGGKSAGVTTS